MATPRGRRNNGYYWSSEPFNGGYSYLLDFGGSSTNSRMTPSHRLAKGNGLAVRCVKKEP